MSVGYPRRVSSLAIKVRQGTPPPLGVNSEKQRVTKRVIDAGIWFEASFALNHNQMAQPCGSNVPPWNKGRKVGQKRALRPQEVWLIRDRLRAEGRVRDLALFNLVLCCSARGSRCSLRSRPRPKRQSQSGCPFLVLRCDRSISSPAGSIRDHTFQGGNILVSFAIGSKVRDLTPMCTGHNRCGAPRCC